MNKIQNQKDNYLFDICKLKLYEGHINAIHVQIMNR
jgi:hypothetical protein